MQISPLTELTPSYPKIPSVSRLLKTFSIAYSLILKTTITNITNVLLKILIINPPWPFSLTTTFCFRSSPNLPHVLGAMSLHPIKSITHVPHHKIHPLHHLHHDMHLELKFSLGKGWCVILI